MPQLHTHIDSPFTNQYKGLLETQQRIASQLEHYSFDSSGNEISRAVYDRMMAFWYFEACRDVACRVSTPERADVDCTDMPRLSE